MILGKNDDLPSLVCRHRIAAESILWKHDAEMLPSDFHVNKEPTRSSEINT
jgi:hypothetical protein